ncbi:LOW QUALITY PROTEIN: hypothetical protein MAR_003229, partial [Mya arenaria]
MQCLINTFNYREVSTRKMDYIGQPSSVLKHLERLGKIQTINVRLTWYIPKEKMNLKNGGLSIKVKRSPSGSWYLKPDQLITSDPEAHKTHILKEQP